MRYSNHKIDEIFGNIVIEKTMKSKQASKDPSILTILVALCKTIRY